MTNAIECTVGKSFGGLGIEITFSSIFHGDTYHFSCLDRFDTIPFPKRGFDKEETEGLRDWLTRVLHNYDATSNLCQGCFKSLPKTAYLDDRGYWVVACEFCGHQHKICRNE